MRPDLAKPDGEKRATGPLVILRLQLADEHLTQDERREMAAAMVERVKTCEQSEFSRVFLQLSSVRLSLTGDECLSVLEALEPSPFGDSEKKEPAINQGSYRNVVASFPIEELDGVARWLFERIQGERPATHYYEALAEAAAGCGPETATTMMTYYCENVSVAVTSRHWPAVATIAKLVPEATATPLAEKMVAAAEQQSDAQTSLAHMRLAGALANADAKLRYQAFEYVLAKTEYRPEFMGDDTGPKGSLLRGHCAPTIAAIIAAFSPEDKQWAFEKLMATLTGDHASSEALVLVRGLVAMAADLSAEDAERAFEVLVRLNAAEDRRQPETPLLLRQFLEARAPEGRPRLLKLLLPSIIDNRFRQSSSDPQSSFATALMVSSAEGLTSAEARETLNVMYDLLQAQEEGASEYLFRPYLERIATEDRESFAREILGRMQRSTAVSHAFVFSDSVARLGSDVSRGTREAIAGRLLDQFETYLNDTPAGSWGESPKGTLPPDFCQPLGELLTTMDREAAAPLRDRLVAFLCRVVYESDSLPANPEIVALQGGRGHVGSEVAKILGASDAFMSPKVMDTVLYCVASVTWETPPDFLEEIHKSLVACRGTASPGVGERLTKTCLNTIDTRSPSGRFYKCDAFLTIAAAKMSDQDVVPVYQACWDRYLQQAHSRSVTFGQCLSALAARLPAEVALEAVQDALECWPTVTHESNQEILRELYAALFDCVSADKRQAVTKLAKQQGFTRQSVSNDSTRSSTTVKRNVSIDDLADNNSRVRNLPSYLDAQGLLPVEERLAVVRRLDEKGYITMASGYSFEYFVLDWIVRDAYLDPPETVVGLLAEPDCVGLEQRLLTAVLAARHEDRERWSELWELADVFGAAP